jgi:hypothetical protein
MIHKMVGSFCTTGGLSSSAQLHRKRAVEKHKSKELGREQRVKLVFYIWMQPFKKNIVSNPTIFCTIAGSSQKVPSDNNGVIYSHGKLNKE